MFRPREKVLVPVDDGKLLPAVVVGRKLTKRQYLVRFASGHVAWLTEREMKKAT